MFDIFFFALLNINGSAPCAPSFIFIALEGHLGARSCTKNGHPFQTKKRIDSKPLTGPLPNLLLILKALEPLSANLPQCRQDGGQSKTSTERQRACRIPPPPSPQAPTGPRGTKAHTPAAAPQLSNRLTGCQRPQPITANAAL